MVSALSHVFQLLVVVYLAMIVKGHHAVVRPLDRGSFTTVFLC